MSGEDLKMLQGAEIDTLPDNIIIGDSDEAHSIRQMAALAAGTDNPLLLTGPNGSGKQIVARAVHAASSQRNGPFVIANCSAIVEEKASELLFGLNHAPRAEMSIRHSLLQAAKGGTLFLNEVSDLPPDSQAILESLLEGRAVPGMKDYSLKENRVRIISSARKSLASQISEGNFRQDLYYNLSLLSIPVPPLRQRRQDIPVLIDYFQMEIPTAERFSLDHAAMQLLESHNWPGNIRELRNVVARCGLFHPGKVIGARRMGALLNMGQPSRASLKANTSTNDLLSITPGFNLKAYLDDEEMRFIQSALKQSDGVVQHAAELSGLKRTTFIEKMKRHGIERDEFRKQKPVPAKLLRQVC